MNTTILKKINHINNMINKVNAKKVKCNNKYQTEFFDKNRALQIESLKIEYAILHDKVIKYINVLDPLYKILLSGYDEQLTSNRFQLNQVISDCNIGVITIEDKRILRSKLRGQNNTIKGCRDSLELIQIILNKNKVGSNIDITYFESDYISL